MSRLLSSMNQYYSLTNINSYNINDDDGENVHTSSETDDIQQEQTLLFPAPPPPLLPPTQQLDIGYSSDNERIDSPETNNQIRVNGIQQQQQNFYMMKNRKSYSDYHMSCNSKKMSKYKKFFSRYSRTKISNSDDDYIADEDEDCAPTSSSSDSTESGGLLNAYKIPSFKKSRINSDNKKQLSNTTSAYDTSSNLSNEGHFNNIYKEFQNNELNFQNEGKILGFIIKRFL